MKKNDLGVLLGHSSVADDLLEIDSFELGYRPHKDEDFNILKQLTRLRQEKKYAQIPDKKYLLAEQKLDKYMVSVTNILTNGFQELSESIKKDIIEKVSFKIKDIASSTGLCNQKRDELALNYILRIERLYFHYSDKSLN